MKADPKCLAHSPYLVYVNLAGFTRRKSPVAYMECCDHFLTSGAKPARAGVELFFAISHKIASEYVFVSCQNLSCAPKERVLFVNVAADSLLIKRADCVVLSHPSCNLDTRAG